MELLSCTATLPGCDGHATLPGCDGQWKSCNTLTHCLGAVGSATPSGQCNSYNTLPHCVGAGQYNSCNALGGCTTLAMHCHTARGRWVVQLLQCAGPPAGGRGVLPRRRSLPKNRFCAMHCLTVWGQWAVQLLQCTASLPGDSG